MSAQGTQCYGAKMTDEKVRQLRRMVLVDKRPIKEACAAVGISRGRGWAIVEGRGWKHVR